MLRWAQFLLLAGAVSLLAYCAFVLLDAGAFQREEDRQLERLVTLRQEANGGARQTAPADGLIGRIEVPRLGVSAIVMEGISATILRRAAGHIPGTALPGQSGNIGISGHRDTFFRPLRNIRRNDIITLSTPAGEYRYRVVSTSVVRPDNVAVLNPGENEILTLVTCYPFYFVGPAPSRFIVRAERDDRL